MKLFRTRTAEAVTVRLEFTTVTGVQQRTLSATISALLDREPHLVESLLWFALARKLEAFVAAAVTDDAELMLAHDASIHTGERLVRYVFAAPQQHNTEGLLKVCTSLQHYAQQLVPLVNIGGDPAMRLDELHAILHLGEQLRDHLKGVVALVEIVEIVDEPMAAAA